MLNKNERTMGVYMEARAYARLLSDKGDIEAGTEKAYHMDVTV